MTEWALLERYALFLKDYEIFNSDIQNATVSGDYEQL